MHLALGLSVKRTCCLVENENSRISKDRDCHALGLLPGKSYPAVTHHGVVSVGKLKNELVGVGHLGRRYNRVRGRGIRSVRDVSLDHVVEQECLLGDHAKQSTVFRQVKFPYVRAVQGNATLDRIVETDQQVGDGGLAYGTDANQRYRASASRPASGSGPSRLGLRLRQTRRL